MITVVIPTSGKSLTLSQTLRSLRDQTIDCEVIVVENPLATPEAVKMVRDLGFMHTTSEQGANKARNTGAGVASHNVIAFTDDDLILPNTWAESYWHAHKVYNAGIIGGPVELQYESKPAWIAPEMEGYLARVDHDFNRGLPYELFQSWELHVPLVSANFSLRKEVFDRLGGFDETQGYIGDNLLAPNDEINLILGATKYYSPGLIYLPNNKATHVIPKSRTNPDYLIRRCYGQGYADMRSLKKMRTSTSFEIFEYLCTERPDLIKNHPGDFYYMFADMSRVNRIFATMIFSKMRNAYFSGLMACVGAG